MELKTSNQELKKSKIERLEIKIALELLESKYPDLLNHSMKQIASIIEKEFSMICTVNDLERYFELDNCEDFEREGRKIEYDNTN